MTAPAANGNHPPITDRGDVRRHMRVVRNGEEPPSRPDSPSGSAYTRAIPDNPDVRQPSTSAKADNFASPHVADVKQAWAGSWPLNDRPSNLAEVARKVWPAKGEYASKTAWCGAVVVGVFRLAVTTAAYLMVLAVDSRTRAAVALALAVLTAAVVLISRAVPA